MGRIGRWCAITGDVTLSTILTAALQWQPPLRRTLYTNSSRARTTLSLARSREDPIPAEFTFGAAGRDFDHDIGAAFPTFLQPQLDDIDQNGTPKRDSHV